MLIDNDGNIAGSLDYEEADAQSFADWGVDYLKYDNCYHMGRFGTPLVSFNRFNAMAEAIKKTGRSILYSLCSWGEDYVHTVSQSRPTLPLTYIRAPMRERRGRGREEKNSKANSPTQQWVSGEDPLPIHGASRATSTTRLRVPTTCARAPMPPTRNASRPARTARCWRLSTRWRRTLIGGCPGGGTTWTCSRLATAA